MLEVKNEEWRNLMEDITTSHETFWKLTKALKSEGYLPTPPHKKPDSSLAVDDLEKAECLADSLELQYSHTIPSNDSHYITRIDKEIRHKTSLEPRDDLSPVSLDEIQKLVKNARKAPGLDGISNKAIKCFPLTLLSLLVAIFNACLKNCYFPPVCKEAEVIAIHKPGKPRDLPASYRPISLLSGLDRHFMFRHENTHSTRRPIRAGILQGSTLSLLLYSAYTSDIPRSSAGIQLALFADDITLYLCGATERNICPHLQGAIDELVLHRDLNFPSITNYIKNASERFVSITESHSNPLLSAAVSYEAPPPYHFIRRGTFSGFQRHTTHAHGMHFLPHPRRYREKNAGGVALRFLVHSLSGALRVNTVSQIGSRCSRPCVGKVEQYLRHTGCVTTESGRRQLSALTAPKSNLAEVPRSVYQQIYYLKEMKGACYDKHVIDCETNPKKKLSKMSSYFLTLTTLHGFKYLRSSYKSDKQIWTVCCIASAACAAVLFTVLWARFIRNSVLLTLSPDFPQLPENIAVCQRNVDTAMAMFRGMHINESYSKTLALAVGRTLGRRKVNQKSVQMAEALLRQHNFTIKTGLLKYAPPCNQLVKSGGATPLVDVGDIRREAVGGRRRRRRLAPPLLILEVHFGRQIKKNEQLDCAERICGCSNSMTNGNLTEELRPCSLTEYACLWKIISGGSTMCACPRNCNEANIEVKLQEVSLKSISTSIDPFYSDIDVNTSIVFHTWISKVLSRSFIGTSTESWLTLLSSLGGVFNMFLGVGLFTVVELVYFLIIRVPLTIRHAGDIANEN
ncbi:Probable RNA-directed DNA polymerase from transposon BS [Eumeta japonica]|uniref:Probable RNA-directed DNA polymerase from transposon BS n=1 Tax=Eumeta variegata TaxID=151549 RepID=A0A4C1SM28_EUMVA|nr:Probable RNA-directed DNA polymerase from transposon BS [Eumeta japonica]